MPYKNILLIDDDDDDQEIFLAALREISSSVQYNYVNNARKALEKLASGEIIPEVIFLDLNMPMMTGQEFLAHIKKVEKLSEIPVIIFSTSADPSTKQLTKQLGARDYITKPGDFDQLVNILQPFII